MTKIKDTDNLTLTVGNVTIQACDVDVDGNVENVDVIVDGTVILCANIQTHEAYGVLVRALWRGAGIID